MRMRKRHPTPAELGLTAEEGRVLRALTTPQHIQEFVVGLHANFEEEGDTLRSVRGVLRHRRAHCIEAAFVAACALWLQGEPPLIMDLTAKGDSDHVIAIFRRHGCWGAISKSNHVWLRWRDPVYRSLRELAMSYFHEYTNKHRKTLRTYSRPVGLDRFPIGDVDHQRGGLLGCRRRPRRRASLPADHARPGPPADAARRHRAHRR